MKAGWQTNTPGSHRTQWTGITGAKRENKARGQNEEKGKWKRGGWSSDRRRVTPWRPCGHLTGWSERKRAEKEKKRKEESGRRESSVQHALLTASEAFCTTCDQIGYSYRAPSVIHCACSWHPAPILSSTAGAKHVVIASCHFKAVKLRMSTKLTMMDSQYGVLIMIIMN